jgi:hypothetical protein
VDKAEGPGRLLEHLRTLVAEIPGPSDDSQEDRSAAVRAELDALHRTARSRPLGAGERRRYEHLLLIEARLLHRADPDNGAVTGAQTIGGDGGLRGWQHPR